MRKYGSYKKAGMRFARQSRKNYSKPTYHNDEELQLSEKDVNAFVWFIAILGFILIMIIISN